MDALTYIYGPLSKQYCLWFYIFSVFGFISMCISIIAVLFIGITKKKDLSFFGAGAYIVILQFAIYFQNRLLYNMCTK